MEITGAAVNVGKQGYGLVITGDIAPFNPCPADFNGDLFVEDADFVIFASAYEVLACADASMPAGCPADLNGDQFVDDTDFVLFSDAYSLFVCP